MLCHMQLFPIGIIKNFWEILLYDWLWLLFQELHTDNLYFVSSLFHLSLSLHFFIYLCGSAFAFPMIVLDHYYSVLTETGPYCINWLSAHTAITGNSSNITKYAYLYGFFPHLSLVSFLDHDSATSSFSWCLYRDIVLICWSQWKLISAFYSHTISPLFFFAATCSSYRYYWNMQCLVIIHMQQCVIRSKKSGWATNY